MTAHLLGRLEVYPLGEYTWAGVATCSCGEAFTASASARTWVVEAILRRYRRHREAVRRTVRA